jgi:hypothetical protein
MDRRWQLALDCLDAQHPPFAKGTLVEFRQRLIAADADRRLVEQTVQLAERSRGFGATALRAALDSSPLWGAGRVEDTYNLMGHALRKALGVLAAGRGLAEGVADLAGQAGTPMLASSSLKAALDLDYARTVLAQVDFGDRQLPVRRWYQVQYLKYLTRLTNVSCRGELSVLDPLVAVPNLGSLELLQNTVLRSLAPLTRCASLRSLHLAGCPLLRDLSPLAATAVDTLGLHLMSAALGTLRGSRIRSLSIRDRAIESSLGALPAELPLHELTVDNRPPRRSLRGIGRWPELERVKLFGAPDAADVQELATLPRLRHLELNTPASVGALADLPGIGSLRRLDVRDIAPPARGEIMLVLSHLEPIEVYVDDRPLREVMEAAGP